MSRSLKTGTYFGQCAQAYRCAHGVLTDVAHSCGCTLPEHGHERAYISLLVSGSYRESIQGKEFFYRPMDAVFHPLGALHSDTVGNAGARFICMELLPQEDEWGSNSREWRPYSLPADLSLLMIRLYRHLRQDSLCPTIIESSVVEFLGAALPNERREERRVPRWMPHCIDYIEANYATSITVRALAVELNVHPVHVAREFRRRFGETIGEYVNKTRLRAACNQLLTGVDRLADVAATNGFYDQSHFVRVFKAQLACVPSEFRRLVSQESREDVRSNWRVLAPHRANKNFRSRTST
jgi:AraC family transcriptional regulator